MDWFCCLDDMPGVGCMAAAVAGRGCAWGVFRGGLKLLPTSALPFRDWWSVVRIRCAWLFGACHWGLVGVRWWAPLAKSCQDALGLRCRVIDVLLVDGLHGELGLVWHCCCNSCVQAPIVWARWASWRGCIRGGWAWDQCISQDLQHNMKKKIKIISEIHVSKAI